MAILEDDVDGLEQQPIRQAPPIAQVRSKEQLVDVEPLGEELRAAGYLGGGMQQSHGGRAHTA